MNPSEAMPAPFVKFLRSDATDELMRFPNCFVLLAQIAQRARREVPAFNPYGLQVGEAQVGDHLSIGLTRQEFRTALANLQKWGFVTSRTTNKGTIVKLCNSDVYDINSDTPNQPVTSQQPAVNQPTTTNKNVKKERKKSPLSDSASASSDGLDFETFWQAYNRKEGNKGKMAGQWQGLPTHVRKHILTHLNAYRAAKTKNGPQFMPHPQTFLNGHYWEAEGFVQPLTMLQQLTPNQMPSNVQAGTITGSTIPSMKSMLKPELNFN